MSTTAFGASKPDFATETRAGGWLVGIGAALALLGIVASANLFLASIAVITIVAAAMFAGGILMLLHAFRVVGWGWTIVWAICAILYLIGAAGILYDPLYAVRMLTFWLVPLFAASGLIRSIGALFVRGHGWGWIAISGLFSVALAALIARGWPANSLWVLGLLLSVDLLLQGTMMMLVGFTLRNRPIG